MADEIKVNPTPIQRNTLDIGIELTQLYYQYENPKNKEEIAEIFLYFYSAAKAAESTYYKHLEDLMPDKLKKIIEDHS